MKKLSVIFLFAIFACGKPSHIPEVTIGNQIWMTKNLDVTTFRNGETIPEIRTVEEWKKARDEETPAWCYYGGEPSNGIKYGKLYNWYAVSDPRGLAPKGWHIPKAEEWTILTDYLGVEEAGTQMKNSSGWYDNGNGSNSSGFAGLPGGYIGGGEFSAIGTKGYWWSSSVSNSRWDWSRTLAYDKGNVASYEQNYGKEYMYSVRCIKDESTENKSIKVSSEKNTDFGGNWVADANSQVRYDGNRITDITITKNGANYLFVFNKNDLGLKTMGTIDQSNNISLYEGRWLVALDATDKDNLFLKGEMFHRVK